MIPPIFEQHLKTIVYAGAGLWIALVGWLQFDGAAGLDRLQFRALDAPLQRCEGIFSKRYDCKSAILLKSGHDIFLSWSGKFVIVLVPPMLLVGGLAFYNRKRKKIAASEARKRALARRAMTGVSRIDELEMEAASYKSEDASRGLEAAEDSPAVDNAPRAEDAAPSGHDGKVSADDVRRALFGR